MIELKTETYPADEDGPATQMLVLTWKKDGSEDEYSFIKADDCCADHTNPEAWVLSSAVVKPEDNHEGDLFDRAFDHFISNEITDPAEVDRIMNELEGQP